MIKTLKDIKNLLERDVINVINNISLDQSIQKKKVVVNRAVDLKDNSYMFVDENDEEQVKTYRMTRRDQI